MAHANYGPKSAAALIVEEREYAGSQKSGFNFKTIVKWGPWTSIGLFDMQRYPEAKKLRDEVQGFRERRIVFRGVIIVDSAGKEWREQLDTAVTKTDRERARAWSHIDEALEARRKRAHELGETEP